MWGGKGGVFIVFFLLISVVITACETLMMGAEKWDLKMGYPKILGEATEEGIFTPPPYPPPLSGVPFVVRVRTAWLNATCQSETWQGRRDIAETVSRSVK